MNTCFATHNEIADESDICGEFSVICTVVIVLTACVYAYTIETEPHWTETINCSLGNIPFTNWLIYHVPMRTSSERSSTTPRLTRTCQYPWWKNNWIVPHSVMIIRYWLIPNAGHWLDSLPPCWGPKWCSNQLTPLLCVKDIYCRTLMFWCSSDGNRNLINLFSIWNTYFCRARQIQ